MEENYNLLEPRHFDGRPPREFKNRYIWIALAAVAAVLLAAVLLSRPGREEVSQEGEEPAPRQTEIERGIKPKGRDVEARLPPGQPLPAAKPEPAGPHIAIIIDDVGYSFEAARRFIEMDPPLSFAVLPFAPNSDRIARLASEKGREVILHLPMEPYDYPETDPGPGALLSDMSPQELLRTLKRDLGSVPQAVGVNNHMGSRLTHDAEAMETVMKYLKERDLFFVDSLTAPNTVAYDVAREMGLRVARRRIFLDNVKEVGAITDNLMLLVEKARKADGLVGIAHPHPATYQALKQALPRLKEEGVRLVPVSDIVK